MYLFIFCRQQPQTPNHKIKVFLYEFSVCLHLSSLNNNNNYFSYAHILKIYFYSHLRSKIRSFAKYLHFDQMTPTYKVRSYFKSPTYKISSYITARDVLYKFNVQRVFFFYQFTKKKTNSKQQAIQLKKIILKSIRNSYY